MRLRSEHQPECASVRFLSGFGTGLKFQGSYQPRMDNSASAITKKERNSIMRRRRLWPIILLVIIIAVGFYRGWFALSGGREAESRKVDVHLTVDPDKAKQDAKAVKEAAKDLTEKAREKATDSGDQSKEDPAPP